MKQHVTRIASNCFYQLRADYGRSYPLSAKKSHLSWQLISAFVLTRLDYCNSLLAGLPRSTIAPLQRVQNAAARLVLNLGFRDHVTPALQQLHWLAYLWSTESSTSCVHCCTRSMHTGRAPRLTLCSQSLNTAVYPVWGPPTLPTTSNAALVRSLVNVTNVASVMLVQLPGTLYLPALSSLLTHS